MSTKTRRVKLFASDPVDRRKIRSLVLKHGLDRRKVYCVGCFGELASDSKYTGDCNGCSCDCGDPYGCSHGCAGCDECGYTGKRINHFPDPVRVGDRYIQIHPSFCSGCGAPQEHFDSGCEPCAAKCYVPKKQPSLTPQNN